MTPPTGGICSDEHPLPSAGHLKKKQLKHPQSRCPENLQKGGICEKEIRFGASFCGTDFHGYSGNGFS